MVILPIIVAVSLVLYIYYKVIIFKYKDKLTRAYFNAKARICLGIFVLVFGINAYLFYQTRLALFIGIVFLVLGGMQLNLGVKQTKHYRKEWKRLYPNGSES